MGLAVPRKAKRIKARPKIQFTCMVDAELLTQANKARTRTWVEIVEEAMRITVQSNHRVKR